MYHHSVRLYAHIQETLFEERYNRDIAGRRVQTGRYTIYDGPSMVAVGGKRERGTPIQHAGNGREKRICGYKVIHKFCLTNLKILF